LRDDNNTGNWHVLVNTAGLSSTDPDYLSYPNGNWRIDALGFNCTSTVKTTDTRSHSNTIKLVPVGIENVELNNELIIIYPNPAHSMLYIDNISNDATLSVYDYCGKLVMNSSATKTLDISRLSNGVYCLKVTDGKGVGVKRFVKE
jgi:hypothetical protein